MALSFFSLPPEVRVQIYRYLLCQNTWIQPNRAGDQICLPDHIIARTQGMSLLTSVELGPRTDHSLECAILRTCRMIYAEGMPVLYGENSFLYMSSAYFLDRADYPEVEIPEKSLDFMKHLELEVQVEWWTVQTIAKDLAASILYFARRRCDLHTFKLSLSELFDLSEGEEDTCHHLIDNLYTSSELAASLVALQVSESLTISVRCSLFGYYRDNEIPKEAHDKCQGIVNRLASAKGMTAMMEVDFFKRKDDEGAHDYNVCNMSWCLRPQRSQPQSSKTTSVSD